jgi:hypothetical protein
MKRSEGIGWTKRRGACELCGSCRLDDAAEMLKKVLEMPPTI